MNIYGFTLLRNAIKYDYPFHESLNSLGGICEKIYLALGKSEDDTESQAKEIKKIVPIPTIWDENLRESGLILSQQTNIALETLRNNHKNGWAFHLQADEIIADYEYEQILADFKQADAEGCDAVSFRYLHFWQSYNQIAYLSRWYSQEIRAIRVDGSAISYGDAQSFAPNKKVFFSNAHIYHYGHVRDAVAYERKKNDFHRWWHSDTEMKKIISKSKKNDQIEPALKYLGPHPTQMRKRINRQIPKREFLLVYGSKNALPVRLWKGINVHKIEWTDDFQKILNSSPENILILKPLSLWEKIISLGKFNSRIPSKMLWREGREWTPEFSAIMRLSEKGFCVDY